MSRYLQQNIDGEFDEIIDSMDECRYLIDGVCCNGDCKAMVADYPYEEYCTRCPHFTKEEA